MTIAPIDRATIEAVAQLIAQKFDPEQIILFGSHARGNAGSHSDVDLLVVLKSLDDWPKRGNPIRLAIGEKFVLPVDVIVTTPEHLSEQRKNPYSFVNTALESRAILYERKTSTKGEECGALSSTNER
ncbi:MAG: nucleotidyltransferase domain-containing protein [Caldilineaceae bacterium SB0664_bin_27]|uniref:Nucleotidyltransferase domain-containing protein n=1 Tax=Caldilineaceae bacterium SB0664_bin_27 TaxID=2605260 RepID=A0A6B0YWW0_9CHLR|nr:nucleotidyltransferase domain-containing protein [Caldilineaceae bacterium SB0664_bin_27]